MSWVDFEVALLAAAALACVVLGPASARTPVSAKYGGTIVVGLSGGDPDSLDPTVSRASPTGVVLRPMCEALYGRDANSNLAPVLAAAVPTLSKDKLTYTIQLRKGIQFNDGTPFNAQAVVTTVQRYMTYPGSSKAGAYANVDSVIASGLYTVVYHLNARDSTFNGNASILSPAQLNKLGANFASNPICVGPFMFDHRVVGDNITLIKSPYYYDQKDVYLDKIVFKPTDGGPGAAAALKAGDIQVLDQVSSTEIDGVRQTPSLRVIQAPQLAWRGININIGNKNGVQNLPYTNVGTPLASSVKLRQAFEEAIDRNTLNKIVFDGLMQVSCTVIPPANVLWFGATKVPCTPYNPTDAKKLVATSGIPNPTVHLLTLNTTDFFRITQFIQAQEAAVGINVVIDSVDNATGLARQRDGNYDARMAGSVPGDVEPNARFSPQWATSGSLNYTGYSNPRLDLILANGVKATDIKARSTLYHVAQQIISNDRPTIILYNPVTLAAFSANLTGVELTASSLIDIAHARYK